MGSGGRESQHSTKEPVHMSYSFISWDQAACCIVRVFHEIILLDESSSSQVKSAVVSISESHSTWSDFS